MTSVNQVSLGNSYTTVRTSKTHRHLNRHGSQWYSKTLSDKSPNPHQHWTKLRWATATNHCMIKTTTLIFYVCVSVDEFGQAVTMKQKWEPMILKESVGRTTATDQNLPQFRRATATNPQSKQHLRSFIFVSQLMWYAIGDSQLRHGSQQYSKTLSDESQNPPPSLTTT